MKTIDSMKQLLEAIEAFTDPEGNMPADTGKFNDLKDCIAPLRTFIAAEEVKPPLSAERAALVESLRAHAYLHEALDDPTQVQWGACLRASADMLAADARVPMTQTEIDDLPSCGINDGSQQWLRGYLRLVEAHHGIGVNP